MWLRKLRFRASLIAELKLFLSCICDWYKLLWWMNLLPLNLHNDPRLRRTWRGSWENQFSDLNVWFFVFALHSFPFLMKLIHACIFFHPLFWIYVVLINYFVVIFILVYFLWSPRMLFYTVILLHNRYIQCCFSILYDYSVSIIFSVVGS